MIYGSSKIREPVVVGVAVRVNRMLLESTISMKSAWLPILQLPRPPCLGVTYNYLVHTRASARTVEGVDEG